MKLKTARCKPVEGVVRIDTQEKADAYGFGSVFALFAAIQKAPVFLYQSRQLSLKQRAQLVGYAQAVRS